MRALARLTFRALRGSTSSSSTSRAFRARVRASASPTADPQLDACAAGVRDVVACPAGLQPSNCIRSEPTALGFAIIPPALRYAECLISRLRLSHATCVVLA